MPEIPSSSAPVPDPRVRRYVLIAVCAAVLLYEARAQMSEW